MANSIVWVDIPVVDLDRAMRFYSRRPGRRGPEARISGDGDRSLARLRE